jgi:hypothetical protein
MLFQISSSSRSLKHSDYELHQSEKNNSCKHQASESTGETSSAQSLMEVSAGFTLLVELFDLCSCDSCSLVYL